MQPERINDRTTFEEWFRTRPLASLVAVGHRAAMRLAPAVWREDRGDRSLSLQACRALLTGGVAAKSPELSIRVTAREATLRLREELAALDRLGRPDTVMRETLAGIAMIAHGLDDPLLTVSAGLERLEAGFLKLESGTGLLWATVWEDARALTTDADPLELPLWNSGNTLAAPWQDTVDAWADAGPDWAFWRRWYQAALDGKPLGPDWDAHWALLEQIALIDPETWDAGPAAVAAAIAEIERSIAGIHAVIAATPNAERIVYDDTAGKLAALPAAEIDGDLRAHILNSVQRAIARFERACGGDAPSNLGPVLRDCAEQDLADLREDLADSAGYDLALHDAIDECLGALRRNFAEQGVRDDPAARRLLDTLERCTIDIVANSPAAREVVEKRGEEMFRRISLEHHLLLDELTVGMAADCLPDLAARMRADLAAANDPDADPEQRRRSRYRTISRLPRGARAMQYSRFRDGQRVIAPKAPAPDGKLWWATALGPSGAILLSKLLGL